MWQQALIIAAVAIGSYLFGNINFALIITKFKKTDIRKVDSGNPGTMNMIRNFGKKLGALTLVLDAVKGAVPCILGWFLVGGIGFGSDEIALKGLMLFTGGRLGLYVAGFCVIVGHIFPVFLKFKGGKGIASSIGVCLVAQPLITAVTLAVGILFIFVFKIGSLGSFIIIGFPLGLEGFMVSASVAQRSSFAFMELASLILIFALFLLTLFAHRKNVYKLFFGTETKTVILKKKKKNVG